MIKRDKRIDIPAGWNAASPKTPEYFTSIGKACRGYSDSLKCPTFFKSQNKNPKRGQKQKNSIYVSLSYFKMSPAALRDLKPATIFRACESRELDAVEAKWKPEIMKNNQDLKFPRAKLYVT